MTNYKLTYFDATGMGEVNRYLFAYGGIKYEDERISSMDDFYKNIKKDLPFGLLPILDVDGKIVAQSLAIARFLATKVGLHGNDTWENLLIDEAVAHIDDFRMKLSIGYWESEPDVKEKKMTEVKSEHFPYYLTKFEALIEKNSYFALGRLTWADIFFASLQNYLNNTTETEILKEYPNLRKLVATVEGLPGIKEWIAKRPKTFL